MDHQSIVGIIKGLEIKEIVESEKMESKSFVLTQSGKKDRR